MFKSVFPISDFSDTALLEFVKYEFEPPKYDVDECRQRGMTFAAPLKVTLRLIVFDVDPETGAKSVKDIKEQDVYMGDMPLMTDERHLHRQRHRARHRLADAPLAGRVLRPRQGQDPLVGQAAVRRPHHSLSRLLARHRVRRQGHRLCAHRPPPQDSGDVAAFALGMDGEEILVDLLQHASSTRATKDGWRVPFDAERMKGIKADRRPRSTPTPARSCSRPARSSPPRTARQLAEKGLKALRATDEDLVGQYIAEDLVNPKTGEIYAEAGDEITEKLLKAPGRSRLRRDPGPRHRPRQRRPLHPQHAGGRQELGREDALFDIYRVMRPGEPPTLDTAEAMFHSLFFDPERYDLSAVGRVKMNMRLDLDAEDTVRTLRKEDILAVVKALVDLRDGKGEIDDIDHLGNRRVRSVGELMENQYRLGLLRMERAIKERMSSVEIDTVMPQDLINAKPAAAAVREFFGSSQLSQFMDQTNPLSEITHKRRLSALGPGGLTRERAGFEVRDVHPTHYGRICPIETPEGPNIGLINSLATFARVNKYGFIETPVPPRAATARSPTRSSTSRPWRRRSTTSPRPTPPIDDEGHA